MEAKAGNAGAVRLAGGGSQCLLGRGTNRKQVEVAKDFRGSLDITEYLESAETAAHRRGGAGRTTPVAVARDSRIPCNHVWSADVTHRPRVTLVPGIEPGRSDDCPLMLRNLPVLRLDDKYKVPYQLCQTHFLKNCARPLRQDLNAFGASVRRRAEAVRKIGKQLSSLGTVNDGDSSSAAAPAQQQEPDALSPADEPSTHEQAMADANAYVPPLAASHCQRLTADGLWPSTNMEPLVRFVTNSCRRSQVRN